MLGVSYSLAQWPTLADSDLIAVFNTESRAYVRSQVLVSLLVARVFGDEMEILAADDESTVHLSRHDCASEDTATDRHKAGEGTFLVCGVMLRSAIVFHCIQACLSAALSSVMSSHRNPDHVPMYEPSIANLGVRKPSPTSLYHRRPPLPTLLVFPVWRFWLTKICGCF